MQLQTKAKKEEEINGNCGSQGMKNKRKGGGKTSILYFAVAVIACFSIGIVARLVHYTRSDAGLATLPRAVADGEADVHLPRVQLRHPGKHSELAIGNSGLAPSFDVLGINSPAEALAQQGNPPASTDDPLSEADRLLGIQ
ncbi:hypothetical protein DIPPA_19519 [Diplonema papillatum]|nr:hypothetical protein DIPPA_19519 [Diplonema papillatum]